ncbi:MAG TPA: hypothetical protein VGB38_09200 [bacterium]
MAKRMRYQFSSKPEKCPKCGSPRVADILYGLQVFHKVEKDIEAGRIVLGGCIVDNNNPEWQCVECKTNIYHKKDWFSRSGILADKH